MQIENIWNCKLDKENAEKIVSVIKEIVSIEFNITVLCRVPWNVRHLWRWCLSTSDRFDSKTIFSRNLATDTNSSFAEFIVLKKKRVKKKVKNSQQFLLWKLQHNRICEILSNSLNEICAKWIKKIR